RRNGKPGAMQRALDLLAIDVAIDQRGKGVRAAFIGRVEGPSDIEQSNIAVPDRYLDGGAFRNIGSLRRRQEDVICSIGHGRDFPNSIELESGAVVELKPCLLLRLMQNAVAD